MDGWMVAAAFWALGVILAYEAAVGSVRSWRGHIAVWLWPLTMVLALGWGACGGDLAALRYLRTRRRPQTDSAE